jgi:hypothetical protein
MKQLYLTFILTLLLSCDSKDDFDSFKTVDTSEYNNLLKGGIERNEFWTKDPVAISHKLFTYENNPRTLKIEVNSYDQTHVTVIHTLEGPYDDAAEGEKRIIKFEKSNEMWTITNIRVGQKCWKRRGHTNYSGQGCS